MSAFYDIWIGADKGTKPLHTRLTNNAWSNIDTLNENCWVSLPGKKKDFIKTASNDTYSMILLGQLYEDISNAKLLTRLINHTEGSTSQWYDPAGHYIIFLYNANSAQYQVFTNRLGTYHAYWSSIDGINSIGTYYIGLAKEASTKTLNWEGISGFMQIGFFPGNTTYLQGINILEPASHYTFDADLNLIQHKRYWDWSYQPKERPLTDWHQELNDILQSSLSSALKDKTVSLPISGGLDSRLLAGKLTDTRPHTYHKLWAYSYGFNHTSIETSIAAKIAVECNIDFTPYTVPDYLFDKAADITDAVELFQYINGTRQASMTETLDAKADVVVGGHWGDVWMDDMKVQDGNITSYFKHKIIKKGSDWLLDEICKPHYAKANEVSESHFSEWSKKYDHITDPDFKMKIFKTDQWSFRWTVPSLRMYQAGAMPVLPFYDKRIVEFFSTIPTSLLNDREFEVAFIKTYYPNLARIKWQEYDCNLYNYKTFNNRNIIYRAYKKVERTLSTGNPISRNWELFYLNGQGRAHLEDILINNKAFCQIVPAEKSRQLLDMFYEEPSAGNGYAVSMLHTLAQFMKTVF